VAIIPASRYEDLPGAPGTAGQQAEPGFDVRMADGKAVVVRVSPGLPAAEAGVRPGWRILKIDGQELAPDLTRIQKVVTGTPGAPFYQALMIQGRLRGEEGKEVAVAFLDGAGRETTLSIPRARPQGHLVRQFGGPPRYVRFEARKVDRDIAYFSLSNFY